MKSDIYDISYLNIESKRVLMCVGEAQWAPTRIGGRWKAKKGGTHGKALAHTLIRIGLSCGWMGNIRRIRIFLKYRDQPREYILFI